MGEPAGDSWHQPRGAPGPGQDSDPLSTAPPSQLVCLLVFLCRGAITLSNLAFSVTLISKYVAYLVLYVRQDCHQLLQRLVVGPQLHSVARGVVT